MYHRSNFPECSEPGPWDFMYFSLRRRHDGAGLRRAGADHARCARTVLCALVVSFFFNTVLSPWP